MADCESPARFFLGTLLLVDAVFSLGVPQFDYEQPGILNGQLVIPREAPHRDRLSKSLL